MRILAAWLICCYAFTSAAVSSRILDAVVHHGGASQRVEFRTAPRVIVKVAVWSLRRQNVSDPRVQLFLGVNSLLVSSPSNNKHSTLSEFNGGSFFVGLPHLFPLPRDYPSVV
ncbi:MAG TPA: hypothetical protein VLY03_10185 [Bacteroidota bacterium]|nr:hypothetical protein [Bacteroidota bacterium]